MREELMQSIGVVRAAGNTMAETSREFANDPLAAQKRAVMTKASRELLNAVARLLTIGDMIDLNLMLKAIQAVQQDLANMKNSNNQDELTHNFKNYGRDAFELTNLAGKRQSVSL